MTEADRRNILDVEHVTMRFGGLLAVSDLSFGVCAREITALIGPNSTSPDVTFPGECSYPYQNNPPCTTAALIWYFGARSRHPGGVNVGIIDGSVRFMKNSINLVTWSALSIRRGSST